ncbi:MAG: DUF1971 domain-containing protein [Nostocoides sp.]
MRIGELPESVEWVRETPRWTAEQVPTGLRGAHQVASGVWGLLRVHAGEVTFVEEESGDRHLVPTGGELVIRSDMPHHVEPSAAAVMSVAFYR